MLITSFFSSLVELLRVAGIEEIWLQRSVGNRDCFLLSERVCGINLNYKVDKDQPALKAMSRLKDNFHAAVHRSSFHLIHLQSVGRICKVLKGQITNIIHIFASNVSSFSKVHKNKNEESCKITSS